jgi:hypothetical protein
VLRGKNGESIVANAREFPTIHPDGKSHTWSLEYHPDAAAGNGQIRISLDAETNTLELQDSDKSPDTTFDRFGIVTSWIDGNSQNVYLDDITYTISQE